MSIRAIKMILKRTFVPTIKVLGVYSPQDKVDLLNRIDFTHKQTKQIPYEANTEEQAQFMEEV